MVKTTVRTHEKKLKELTRHVVLPFTPTETVLTLSGSRLTDDELEILKYETFRWTYTYRQNWYLSHVWFYPLVNE